MDRIDVKYGRLSFKNTELVIYLTAVFNVIVSIYLFTVIPIL